MLDKNHVERKRYKLLRASVLFCGDLPMFVLMVWLIFIGIRLIFVSELFLPVDKSIPHVLEGLECIFLAPLGFLLFRGISDYVIGIIDTDPQSVPTHFLMRIKGLIFGLMAAVAATDLLKRTLSDGGIDYRTAFCGCLFIAVLAGYSLILDRSAAKTHL